MKNLGQYPVYLKGSDKRVWRVIYKDNDKYYMKWYAQYIEVARGFSGYFYSVEKY